MKIKLTGYGFKKINGKKPLDYWWQPERGQIVSPNPTIGGLDCYRGLWNRFDFPVRVSEKKSALGYRVYRVW